MAQCLGKTVETDINAISAYSLYCTCKIAFLPPAAEFTGPFIRLNDVDDSHETLRSLHVNDVMMVQCNLYTGLPLPVRLPYVSHSPPPGGGAENAGPENEGPIKIWKMKDHDVSERGLKMCGHQERLLKAAQQLVNRLKSSTIVLCNRCPSAR